jgi:hypothetical protein
MENIVLLQRLNQLARRELHIRFWKKQQKEREELDDLGL